MASSFIGQRWHDLNSSFDKTGAIIDAPGTTRKCRVSRQRDLATAVRQVMPVAGAG
jgi:hypothetical protein